MLENNYNSVSVYKREKKEEERNKALEVENKERERERRNKWTFWRWRFQVVEKFGPSLISPSYYSGDMVDTFCLFIREGQCPVSFTQVPHM